MSLQPPIVLPTGASNAIVTDAYSKWSGIALDAFATAKNLASQLANIPVTAVPLNTHFETQIPLGNFPEIAAPEAPSIPAFIAPGVPDLPPSVALPALPDLTYVQLLLDKTKDVLSSALDGGAVLPPATARQLRDRAYAEVFEEEQRGVAQAYHEYSARGFSEPAGVLNESVSRVRTAAAAQRQKASRTVYIEEETQAIEGLRQAIAGSLQLEGMNIQVYRTKADLAVESTRLSVEQAEVLYKEWHGRIERVDEELKIQLAQLEYAGKDFDDKVRLYEAKAQVANTAGQFDERRFQLNLAQEHANVDVELKQQDQAIEQMKYITSVMLEIKKALAAIGSTLTSAAMSAVNIGASLSASNSESVGYDLNVSYSGSMEDGF